MMIELSQIRNVFPNWPSELEVAKQSSNWAMMAQSFYCAAIVLNEEMRTAHQRMHEQTGTVISEDVLRRNQVGIPAVFCLAFSLELAIKAALIHQGAIAEQQSGKKLPFASHSILDLAIKVDRLNLTLEERECLQLASIIISGGKYPSGVYPCENRNGVPPYPQFENLILEAGPLYERLMKLATSVDAQPSAADGLR